MLNVKRRGGLAVIVLSIALTVPVIAQTPPGPPPIPTVSDIHRGFIYQIVTDRFFNGDTSNDDPAQSIGEFDPNGFTKPTNWRDYWGGDLAGIAQKMAYLKSMGVAAIWISPPIDNANKPDGGGASGYHGFWPRDMMRIEEHFGDAANGWAAFDKLTAASHASGIKVIVDFVANHTNDIGVGENGALYNNGVRVTDYSSDTGTTPYYHHTPNMTNFEDRYQLQYDTLFGLADLDQTNPWVDNYIKSAVAQLLAHGADGFRFDAVKHVNWGWEYSLENSIANWSGAQTLPTATARPFVFGEWLEGSGDPLYADSVKFSNRSGMNLLDYPLYGPIVDVFAKGKSFKEIDDELNLERSGNSNAEGFAQPNDLVTFFDNHDNPRIQSMGVDAMAVKLALSFVFTCRGVPVVYYGDEQYLHNDTGGGNDPYDRNAMTSFGTTDAVTLIQYLAALRASNPAIAFGTMQQRWINDDVYIYERRLGGNVVLVAISKSETNDQAISGLLTSLPPGSYFDYLNGTMGGVGLTVSGTDEDNNATMNFTLPHRSVSLWVAAGKAGPAIGSITPRVANAGALVTITGAGFGTSGGAVHFSVGGPEKLAKIVRWADGEITATVPDVTAGPAQVTVMRGSATSSASAFTTSTGKLIPVNFSVSGVPALASGDVVMLTGSSAELGAWLRTWNGADGPAVIPATGNALLTVSVPAGSKSQFKFLILHADGSVRWEGGSNHFYTIPASGVGAISVSWQP
ncbi:MAG TPA: alpha-amylase family glycosyl hydrolase [Terracidiphilus sp.]|nr:alpha-amylase family glycosyl hydrolase [Terracidiphilus sp.]